jgi:hypothetical protein
MTVHDRTRLIGQLHLFLLPSIFNDGCISGSIAEIGKSSPPVTPQSDEANFEFKKTGTSPVFLNDA